MKGMLAKVLAIILVLSSTVVAQDFPPVFEEGWIELYAGSMRFFAPYTRDFNGGGARAKGMGNAFIGVSDDISAVSWNPAGLYRRDNPYEQPVMSLSYQSLSANTSSETRPWDEWRSYDYDEVFNGVDFMSLLFPIRIKGHRFVGSLAYTRIGDEILNAGMSLDTMMFVWPQDELDNRPTPFHYQRLTTYQSAVNTINIGFGTRLYNDLSFGLAINAYGGQAAGFQDENLTWDSAVHPNLPSNQRAEGVYENDVTDTTDFSGVYLTIGFKYTGERLLAGLTIKTPHTLKETIDVRVESRWLANGLEQAGSGQVIHLDNNVVELEQPLVIGGGLGYKFLENLLVATDIEYRSYSGGMVNIRDSLRLVPGGTDVEFFTEFNPYWNDSWAFRFGSEYMWQTGNRLFPTVPLRAGFGYIQVPEPDVDGGSIGFGGDFLTFVPVTSTSAMTRWSVGTGVRWEQINLDLSYARTSFDHEDAFWLQRLSADNGIFNLTFTGYF